VALPEFPSTVLETETAFHVGRLVRAAGYELEVTPRPNGADLAAGRDGTIWATFHVDIDQRRPLFLRLGATVWGGARTAIGSDVPWDAKPDEPLSAFVRDRLELACKRGRSQNPDHCAECPNPKHR
jgi:hypothetical protein